MKNKSLTIHQFNLEKEKREQTLRALELEKLDRKISISSNQVKALDIDVKKSEVQIQIQQSSLEGVQISLETNKLNNLISGDSLKALEVTRKYKQQVLQADIQVLLNSLEEKKILLNQSQESFKERLGNIAPQNTFKPIF
jgi:hypothetical protein